MDQFLWDYVLPKVLIVAIILIVFRNQIISYVKEWYYNYQEKKKHDELMRRLHRNDVKFNQKDYMKQLNEQKKNIIKHRREKQEELKK